MRSRLPAVCAAIAVFAVTAAAQQAPLKIASAKITITGTTNVHGYTAATSTVRLVNAKLAAFDGDLWTLAQKPALVEAFEIAIPAASLKSTKDGIDKNMHKALKTDKFADITFRAKSIEKTANGVRAIGTLTIAGVGKDVAIDFAVQRTGANLGLAGELPLVMTDYGVVPPKAMMGMMRTDPKVVIRLELTLAASAS